MTRTVSRRLSNISITRTSIDPYVAVCLSSSKQTRSTKPVRDGGRTCAFDVRLHGARLYFSKCQHFSYTRPLDASSSLDINFGHTPRIHHQPPTHT